MAYFGSRTSAAVAPVRFSSNRERMRKNTPSFLTIEQLDLLNFQASRFLNSSSTFYAIESFVMAMIWHAKAGIVLKTCSSLPNDFFSQKRPRRPYESDFVPYPPHLPA